MNKILVTGGAGFIGSHTVAELVNAGFQPIIIDNFSNSDVEVIQRLNELTNTKIEYHEVDCQDLQALRTILSNAGPIEGVIHFAAYKSVSESVVQPIKYYRNNIESTVSVLQLIEEFDIPNLVFSSSCTVYGQPEILPVTEESPDNNAQSPYGKTKRISENIIHDFQHMNGRLKSCLLRYFNPVGAHPSSLIGELPRNKPENLVPYITQTAANWRDQLTVFGNDYGTPDGTCIRDYIHVVDLAKAHVHALNWLKNQSDSLTEIFNLGQGRGNSVMEIIETFEKVSGISLDYKIGPRRAGDVEQIFADVSKAKNILGWECQLTLEDGLRDAWNWQQTLGEIPPN